ncbi:hypothetical protein CBR_g40434 [Chara braunii]|uniref:Uncharacterized protein n=1 Tax=Chara braunii TaxID=69332 RepID=A0A388LTX3_CHABU|nr:hypothetical protein CBR_g40434 [Chara braunii]|eukprot:GBG85705.1 hypothetical protein CBR_g40434 [Chara braunii]
MLLSHLPQLAKKQIVLASASPRRAELLRSLGLKFDVVPSSFEETLVKSSFPTAGDYAAETAMHKAIDVARKVIMTASSERSDGSTSAVDLVIGADTVVECAGRILEKPADEADAVEMLQLLRGRLHEVYTGVALVVPAAADPAVGTPPLVRLFWEKSSVEFAALDDETIQAYVATGDPLDKAGGYGIQGPGGTLVKGVQGVCEDVVFSPDVYSRHSRRQEQLDLGSSSVFPTEKGIARWTSTDFRVPLCEEHSQTSCQISTKPVPSLRPYRGQWSEPEPSAIGTQKYDWQKKQVFALSATEIGRLLVSDECEFYHDPNMGQSKQGQVNKRLTVRLSQDGSAIFFTLEVNNDIENVKEKIQIPLKRDEIAVMRAAFQYILPHLMGWHAIVDPSQAIIAPTTSGEGRGKLLSEKDENVHWE